VENKKISIFIALYIFYSGIILAQIDFTSSNIPLIFIETSGQEILDDPRIIANMKVINNTGSRNYLTDSINGYDGRISIEIRGSTSQSFPKKQYGFETQKSDGSNNNVSLLGLPSENDWILSAPYSDKSLIRNILAFKLSETLGNYASRTKLCELFLNDEYKGVYVLTEKIKRDENRVDISKLKPDEINGDDLTGGYIIKIDKNTGNSGPSWNSDSGVVFLFDTPKHDEIVFEQKEYIKNYINAFEQALISEDYADENTGYRKYINENSFIDFFIVNEVSKNVDGYFLSTFLFKDKDSKGGKLSIGPVWDYNLSFGNAYYREGYRTDGFQFQINPSTWWWNRILQDDTFVSNLKNRWCNFRDDLLSDETIISTIDSLTTLLDESQERNFQKWDVLGKNIWPNYYIGESYEDEIENLKNWTIERFEWLDDTLKCIVSSVQINSFKNQIYPNPANAKIILKANLLQALGEILITDMTGKIVKQFQTQKSITEIDISNMENGIYFVIVGGVSQKLVKK
tara:strand:- start:5444 stop:6988 length:1545 start_codon:yes stop_codon:yes gene_type:complete